MDLADWSFTVGMAGLGVSALGWSTSILQIRRVRTSSDAVAQALQEERRHVKLKTLDSTVSALRLSERQLADFAVAKRRRETSQAVRDCRDLARQIRHIIRESRVADQGELIEAIRGFLAIVDVCIEDLTNKTINVDDACRPVVYKLSFVTGLCVELQLAIITHESEEAESK
jgi:hypothetical protein